MLLSEAKAKVADWLGVTGQTERVSSTQLGDLVNLAIRDLLKTTRIRFGERTDNVLLSAAEFNTSVTTLMLYPLRVHWTPRPPGGTKPKRLGKMTQDEFDAVWPIQDTDEGQVAGDAPANYCVVGPLVRIAPAPTVDGTLTVKMYSLTADLADEDDSDLLEHCWDAVLWRALSLSSKYLIQDARAPMWDQAWREERAKLMTLYSAAQSSDRRSTMEQPS